MSKLCFIAFALILGSCGLETEPNPDFVAGTGGTSGRDGGGGSGGSGGAGTGGDSGVTGGSGGDGGGGSGGTGGTGGTGGMTGGSGGSAGDCSDDGDCPASSPQCSPEGECVPCTSGDACEGRDATPFCEVTTGSPQVGECVECRQDEHCEGNDDGEYCNNNECVPCKTDADCTDLTKPECNGEGQCVGCTSGDACEDREGTEICVTAVGPKRGHCVACIEDAHCESAEAPECKANNTCGACTSNEACEGREGTPRCNLRAGAETVGECVECSGATEAEDCDGKSCKQTTGECTGTDVNSRAACEPCEADSECQGNRGCVKQTLNGTDIGYFCFSRETVAGCASDTNPDVKPYSVLLPNALSIDATDASEQADYCLPRTSCAAFTDATNYMSSAAPRTCSLSSECGIGDPEKDEAYCIPNDFSVEAARGKCSYLCDSNSDCPTTGFSSCATAGVNFCRP